MYLYMYNMHSHPGVDRIPPLTEPEHIPYIAHILSTQGGCTYICIYIYIHSSIVPLKVVLVLFQALRLGWYCYECGDGRSEEVAAKASRYCLL